MKKLTSLTNDSKQSVTLILDNGLKVFLRLSFIPNQLGWFYSITYGEFMITNYRLVNSPNILREFRSLIPFGLCCTVVDGFEPVYQEDFISNRVVLYVLNEQDIVETETLITRTLPNFLGYPLN